MKKIILISALLLSTLCYAEPTKTPEIKTEWKVIYINKPFILIGDPYKFIEFIQANKLIFDVVGYKDASPIVVILDQEQIK